MVIFLVGFLRGSPPNGAHFVFAASNKSSSYFVLYDLLNLGVKMTARLKSFGIYTIWPQLKPFSYSKSVFTDHLLMTENTKKKSVTQCCWRQHCCVAWFSNGIPPMCMFNLRQFNGFRLETQKGNNFCLFCWIFLWRIHTAIQSFPHCSVWWQEKLPSTVM